MARRSLAISIWHDGWGLHLRLGLCNVGPNVQRIWDCNDDIALRVYSDDCATAALYLGHRLYRLRILSNGDRYGQRAAQRQVQHHSRARRPASLLSQ